ncbi:uncharacterized protein V1518DRAFT_447312, partial [Limtongia smithiae]|uniref:uncharacterized protein n=1 Tax=Limtongia smithiae TaxID=1125753 RepID=UPI0034CE9D3E
GLPPKNPRRTILRAHPHPSRRLINTLPAPPPHPHLTTQRLRPPAPCAAPLRRLSHPIPGFSMGGARRLISRQKQGEHLSPEELAVLDEYRRRERIRQRNIRERHERRNRQSRQSLSEIPTEGMFSVSPPEDAQRELSMSTMSRALSAESSAQPRVGVMDIGAILQSPAPPTSSAMQALRSAPVLPPPQQLPPPPPTLYPPSIAPPFASSPMFVSPPRVLHPPTVRQQLPPLQPRPLFSISHTRHISAASENSPPSAEATGSSSGPDSGGPEPRPESSEQMLPYVVVVPEPLVRAFFYTYCAFMESNSYQPLPMRAATFYSEQLPEQPPVPPSASHPRWTPQAAPAPPRPAPSPPPPPPLAPPALLAPFSYDRPPPPPQPPGVYYPPPPQPPWPR